MCHWCVLYFKTVIALWKSVIFYNSLFITATVFNKEIIATMFFHQGFVSSLFNYSSPIKNCNAICILYGRQAMSYYNACPSFSCYIQCFLDNLKRKNLITILLFNIHKYECKVQIIIISVYMKLINFSHYY